MEIKIKKSFAQNVTTDAFDILQMKKALNQLGYYTPAPDKGIIDTADKEIFDALKAFQKDYALEPTGQLRPDDASVQAINNALKETTGVYMWRTVNDENVRKSHADLDGYIRDWKDSPDPGEDFNCRCWAEVPDKSIPFKANDADVMAFIEGEEKRVPYMYLDTTGNVTVGVGFMLPNAEEAKKLPFITNKMKPASAQEIKDAYIQVTRYRSMRNLQDTFFNPTGKNNLLPLYLTDKLIDKKLRERLQEDAQHLREKFFEFNKFPVNVQKALLDMNFNLGNAGFSPKKWPRLFNAIQKNDWKRAAKESHRKDIGQGRNDKIYDLFYDAE